MSSALHLHFSWRMLVLLGVLLIAPWVVVAVLWSSARSSRQEPAPTAPEGGQAVSGEAVLPRSPQPRADTSKEGSGAVPKGVILGKPGPWGQLRYTPLTLSLPDEFVFVPPPDQPPIQWFFHGSSRQQAVEFLRTAGLSAEQLSGLADEGKWKAGPEGVALKPGDELILSLSPAVRAKIYMQLVEFPENEHQIDPVWFRPERLEDHLKQSGLSAASVALLKSLLYRQGPLLLFADFEPALRRLPDDAERRRFVKVLARKETVLARLRVDPESDADALANYWGVGGRQKDVLPLLRAAQRVEGGTAISLPLLLPLFASERLYKHPFASVGLERFKQDCFWSAFNFFNGDAPDDHFNDVDYLHEVIDRDYARIVAPSQLGDVVMLTTRDGKVLHAAVYLADDLLFTKNGESFTQPWILMHKEDMLDTYNVRHPFSGPLQILYSRRKSL
jgi:hypothetical protein